SDVEQLIRSGAGVKCVLGIVARFDNARVNQPHIVNKEQPDNARVSGAQLKPRQRIIESAEKNRLAQCTSDVEKVVTELQWPPDQCERVNDGTRPKDKNHTQPGRDIKKRAYVLLRQEPAGIVRQEKECNALDDADQSELNINDDRVEFSAPFTWWVHEPTRKRSMSELSRR